MFATRLEFYHANAAPRTGPVAPIIGSARRGIERTDYSMTKPQ